jgi:Ran-binding protein 3
MGNESPEPTNKQPNDSAIQQSTTHSSTASDNEGGEKPVREKLRKTTITPSAAGSKSQTSATDPTATASDADDEASGDRMDGRTRVRLARKRSREDMDQSDDIDHSDDIDDDNTNKATFHRHIRKRSRDMESDEVGILSAHRKQGSESEDSVDARPGTPNERLGKHAAMVQEHLTSPKGKRNREQFLRDDEESEVQTLNLVATKSTDVQDLAAVGAKFRDDNEERDAKRQRDGAKDASGVLKSLNASKESTATVRERPL